VNSDDGEYVHRPGEGDADADANLETQQEEFGRRGWVLVGVIVLSTIVVPGIIYLYPAGPGNLGVSFLAAMLALPMLPAILLGATAVWSLKGD
jgi:hypothetical protein